MQKPARSKGKKVFDDHGFEIYENNDFPRAYLITIRTYGTWLHGDRRYSVGPIFARLKRFYYRVVLRLEVFCRVTIRRTIAAADVAARHAHSQMHPARADLKAVFAAVGTGFGQKRFH